MGQWSIRVDAFRTPKTFAWPSHQQEGRGSEVVAAHGDTHLTAIDIRDGATAEVRQHDCGGRIRPQISTTGLAARPADSLDTLGGTDGPHPPGALPMTDACSKPVPKPQRRSVRWTSFVANVARGRVVRGLEEEGNPQHKVRVEHNLDTLLVHISGEDGQGWTTVAIDRGTREWSIAQRRRQSDAAQVAYSQLYV